MFLITVLFGFFSLNAHADYTPYTADWSDNAVISPGTNRANIYNLDAATLEQMKTEGYKHAMNYPVTVTGLAIPYQPLLNFFKADPTNPLKQLILQIEKNYVGYKNEAEFYEWLGLNKVNPENSTGIYKMPYPNGKKDQFYAGAGLIQAKDGSRGLTFSCFACHSANLFGTTVMGLTNKRVRANKFFHMASGMAPFIPNGIFKASTGATDGEVALFARSKKNLAAVGSIVPQVLGLDTSLPQVALSLAKRNADDYATKSPVYERFPRENELDTFVADSKPLPWWNLKYKTRWLADGSITAGNPILTNFLWNEIGRGTDLKELETWMQNNRKTIDELTVAAFATEAPRYTDFFKASSIDLERAKKGQQIFYNRCQKCHGEYQKAWDAPNASELNEVEILATTNVIYHEKTPVKDVGTDSQRREGIKAFAESLNNLAISKWMKTTVVAQDGYVPPPLVGVWARYPYLHNNSIPNLCALLTRPEDRPKSFVQGPAINKETDYDQECVGYPVGDKIPKAWRTDKEALFVAGKPGLSNLGHSKAFIGEKGEELLTPDDKKNLIHFLKTL
ncbi:MAG: c-type cytochrome [Bacteriovorax sp.]